ncbi:MAG: type II secretion system protein [Candidatus Levybacteria bacterium]|nr:type II secretion system protein [Candidatus Levybacteria bacterium]
MIKISNLKEKLIGNCPPEADPPLEEKLEIGNSRVKREKGFTLVELLIVIAIIGVLTTLLMANFIGVRQRARDAQRKSDLRQIQSALELYRSDQGSYPQILPNCQNSIKSPDCLTSTYINP